MFFVRPHEGEQPMALKPMNCPGHMLLFGSELRSYRDLPIRYAESSTLHRDERGGTLHGLLRVKHITQDDAHVFVTEDQIQGEIDSMIEFVRYLYDRFGVVARGELSTRPEKRLGTDEQWDRAEAALEDALRRHDMDVRGLPGRGDVLRAEDRSPHDGCPGTKLADGHDPARLPDARALRAHLHGAGQPGTQPRRHPSRAARVVGAVHRNPHRALRGGLPVLARAGAGAHRAGGGDPSRGRRVRLRDRLTGAGFRAEVDERDETLGKRIRDAELEKVPSSSSTGIASPTRRSPFESTEAGSRRSRSRSSSSDSECFPSRRRRQLPIPYQQREAMLLPSALCKQERIASSPPGRDPRGFNRVRLDGRWPLLAAVFVVYEEESRVW